MKMLINVIAVAIMLSLMPIGSAFAKCKCGSLMDNTYKGCSKAEIKLCKQKKSYQGLH